MTEYTDLRVVNELQIDVMKFVDVWVRTEKSPVPRSEIVKAMKKNGKTEYAVKYALFGLLQQGFLRKAIMDANMALNKTFYVQLRRV